MRGGRSLLMLLLVLIPVGYFAMKEYRDPTPATDEKKLEKVFTVEADKIDGLINLIEEDLGYQLHRAVQRVKCDLSNAESGEFQFTDGLLEIAATVTRSEFEEWIREEVLATEIATDSVSEPQISKV